MDYRLGNDFVGAFDATCEAQLVRWSQGVPSSIEVTTTGGQWVEHEVKTESIVHRLANGTEEEDILDRELKEERALVPPGPVILQWGGSGAVELHGTAQRPQGPSPSFPIAANGTRFSLSPGTAYQMPPVTYRQTDGGVGSVYVVAQGPNRQWLTEGGAATVHHAATFYLEGSNVTLGDGTRLDVPARDQVRQDYDALGQVSHRTRWTRYAFLHFERLDASFPTAGVAVTCTDVRGHMVGTLNVYYASGHVHLGEQEIPFERQELTLEGRMAWTDHAESGRARATGVGEFHAVGIDFVAAYAAPEAPAFDFALGFWATVAALLGLAVWTLGKLILPFFSRLTEQDVVGHASRRLVMDTVQVNPNVNLRGLAGLTGLTKSEVRYHTRILESRGLLRSHRVNRDRCFVARSTLDAWGRRALQATPELYSKHDPVVAALLRNLSGEPVRLNPLLLKVCREAGVSRVGAWKAVARAERFGILKRQRQGREVWVQCVAN